MALVTSNHCFLRCAQPVHSLRMAHHVDIDMTAGSNPLVQQHPGRSKVT